MLKYALFVCLFTSLAARAQLGRTSELRGEIVQENPVVYHGYSIELCSVATSANCHTIPVNAHGDFSASRLPIGSYQLAVIAGAGVVYRTLVTISPATPSLMVNIPESTRERPVSGVISVRQLTHKVPKQAKKAFEKAEKAHKKGDRTLAIEQAEAAVKIDAEFTAALTFLGVRYMEAREQEKAVDAFWRSTQADPSSSQTHFNLALALINMERYSHAEAAAKRAVELDSGNDPAHFVLGLSLGAMNVKSPEAGVHLKRATRTIPKARIALANWMLLNGQQEEARKELHIFLTKNADAPNRVEIERWISSLR